mgnify:CR=1 FL=1|tara:strand:+ start:151 stop:1509 length:1359 start_codon:yes stop_codon:yes gene_type:complete
MVGDLDEKVRVGRYAIVPAGILAAMELAETFEVDDTIPDGEVGDAKSYQVSSEPTQVSKLPVRKVQIGNARFPDIDLELVDLAERHGMNGLDAEPLVREHVSAVNPKHAIADISHTLSEYEGRTPLKKPDFDAAVRNVEQGFMTAEAAVRAFTKTTTARLINDLGTWDQGLVAAENALYHRSHKQRVARINRRREEPRTRYLDLILAAYKRMKSDGGYTEPWDLTFEASGGRRPRRHFDDGSGMEGVFSNKTYDRLATLFDHGDINQIAMGYSNRLSDLIMEDPEVDPLERVDPFKEVVTAYFDFLSDPKYLGLNTGKSKQRKRAELVAGLYIRAHDLKNANTLKESLEGGIDIVKIAKRHYKDNGSSLYDSLPSLRDTTRCDIPGDNTSTVVLSMEYLFKRHVFGDKGAEPPSLSIVPLGFDTSIGSLYGRLRSVILAKIKEGGSGNRPSQ